MTARWGTYTFTILGCVASLGVGCSAISDCRDDPAACSKMLNEAGVACAEAFQLRQSDKKRKACENAIRVVSEARSRDAVPGLVAILKVPESGVPDDHHRREAAKALGRIGDRSATAALVAAIDYAAGTSSDPRDKQANRSNEEIATALGRLGADEAVPQLVDLLTKSRNRYVVLKSVRALGKIGAKSAIPALEKIALTDSNKFMRKNAVIALGDIGHDDAIDTLIQMMFIEYEGVSFYREASFALFQIGPSAADALLATMAGKNAAVNRYFEKTGGLRDSAVRAKCGYVLGDLRDRRAVGPLLKAFEVASKKYDPVVLRFAAAPLGALGDSRAKGALAAQMLSVDASVRDPIMSALNELGDRSVVPAMIAAMSKAHFVEACVKTGQPRPFCASEQTKPSLYGAQRAAADHASNLAGERHIEAFRAAVNAEQDPKIKAYFAARLPRVEATAECRDNGSCWAQKLGSDDWLLREKAAWELGRIRDAATLDRLTQALADPKGRARRAAIMAYWKYGDGRAIEAIEAQLVKEAGQADFIKVNEDLKRLLVHLKRTRASAA